MQKEAILHIPLSNYAHAINENEVVLRLRAARCDLKSCILYYGDRACRTNPVTFTLEAMHLVAQDELFDYFEVVIRPPFTRVCYYFQLDDGAESVLYYADIFSKEYPSERSEYFQFPINHREDIARIPEWAKSVVIYNIFPDSFATGKQYISKKNISAFIENQETKSKNGGTLRGITENLDYIDELGVNCIYLNPIFAAGEYHKYDLLDYFHIDPCFGTNEDFKVLVQKCHQRGIRIIIDGVFNHCSWNFFAFDDVVKNGEKSKYVDWFYHLNFPIVRPDNEEDIPNYDCFAYERKMPKMNTANPEVREYFCSVCKYWLKEYDIDGWRLDVANEVNADFWREFRKAAKSVKSDSFLIGEVWESAQPWLRGDQFDSTMNYDLRKNCRDFFALGKLDAFEFDGRVTAMRMRYYKNIALGQLNLLDSHDVSRFLSLCEGDPRKLKLAVIFQMTFVGVPSIFYGDEKGIQGKLESEYRHPMIWDADYEKNIFEFYQNLIKLRLTTAVLQNGEYETLDAKGNTGLYVFRRFLGNSQVVIALNASDSAAVLPKEVVPEKANPVLSEGYDGVNLAPWGFAVFS
jgi:cyclomaltodextrinase